MSEEPARQVGTHHVVGRGFERENGEVRRVDALLEPGKAVARQGRQQDEHPADHHERDGEDQKPRGEAARNRL